MSKQDGNDGPLSGIMIIDLTHVLAGPYCTMVLADLGARIIKVEKPGTGDDARTIGPFKKGRDGVDISAYFAGLNRGKESIALDLKGADDRAIFEALLARADVIIENFRPGVMDKLGYGWDDLSRRFPRLIYAAVSGFGQTGPYKDRAAYDMVVQAMGGIMSVTGHPGGPPTRVGTSVGDITAGMFAAIGINAALYERTQTGHGRKIDVSMLDGQIAILENAIARYFATGEVPGPLGARHPSITPFAAFRASDGHLVLAAGNDGLFKRLCAVIDAPRLVTDARFSSNARRTDNEAALRVEIEGRLAKRSVENWLTELDQAGIPCGPINTVADALADPQVLARNMVVEAEDRQAGTMKMAGNPIKISGVKDPATRKPAPALDADREAILREIAKE